MCVMALCLCPSSCCASLFLAAVTTVACNKGYGDRPAFMDGVTGAKITYAELPNRIGGACAYLASMGCGGTPWRRGA